MLPIEIDYKHCNGCGFCEKNCPGDLIFTDLSTNLPYIKYPEECWLCGCMPD